MGRLGLGAMINKLALQPIQRDLKNQSLPMSVSEVPSWPLSPSDPLVAAFSAAARLPMMRFLGCFGVGYAAESVSSVESAPTLACCLSSSIFAQSGRVAA